MADELTVSTPEEYARLTTRKIQVQSGAVFLINDLDAESTLHFLNILPESPEEELKDNKAQIKFVAEHLMELTENVIKPCVIAPKLEKMAFLDIVDLFRALLTQRNSEEVKANAFPKRKTGNKPRRAGK
jgi:hypothetical protein